MKLNSHPSPKLITATVNKYTPSAPRPNPRNIAPIVATFVVGPAISNTSAAPAGSPAATSDAAKGTDATAQIYIGIDASSTSTIPNGPCTHAYSANFPFGINVATAAAITIPTISHRYTSPNN